MWLLSFLSFVYWRVILYFVFAVRSFFTRPWNLVHNEPKNKLTWPVYELNAIGGFLFSKVKLFFLNAALTVAVFGWSTRLHALKWFHTRLLYLVWPLAMMRWKYHVVSCFMFGSRLRLSSTNVTCDGPTFVFYRWSLANCSRVKGNCLYLVITAIKHSIISVKTNSKNL